MQYLPDKTKIFLAALWLWTWVLLQFNRLCGMILKCILISMPDNYVPVPRVSVPVKVIKARDASGNIITNKMQLFLNMKWDQDLFDGKGGIDIDQFAKYVGTSFIWVAYILEYELGTSYNKFISLMKVGHINSKIFEELIRGVAIDVKNKLLYKLSNLEPESILFGEVNFHAGED